MAEFFRLLGQWMGLDPNVAAQVFISVLGTLVAIFATVAAWAAVHIAKLATEDARKSRLEQSRPIFDISPSRDRFTVSWSARRLYEIKPLLSIGNEAPETELVLLLKNVGNGVAINFSAEIQHQKDIDSSVCGNSDLRSLFELGGLEASCADDTFGLVGLPGYYGVTFREGDAFSFDRIQSCEAGSTAMLSIKSLVGDEINKLALACLLEAKSKGGWAKKDVLIKFRFVSVLGEQQIIPIRLSLSGGILAEYISSNGEHHYGIPNEPWSQVSVGLHCHVARLRPLWKWWKFKEPALRVYFDDYVDIDSGNPFTVGREN